MKCRVPIGRSHEMALMFGVGLGLVACCPSLTPSPAARVLEVGEPVPDPTRPDPVELELVAGHGVPEPATWRFSPDGGHVAARDDDGCHVWALPSGRHAGLVRPGELGADPCATWTPPITLGSEPLETPGGRIETRDSLDGLQLWWRPGRDGPARQIPWADDEAQARSVSAVVADPGLRWLWIVAESRVPNHPGHTWLSTSPFDLRRGSLREAPIAWRGPATPPVPQPVMDGQLGWSVGPATAWAEARHWREPGQPWFDYHFTRRSSLVLAPTPQRDRGDILNYNQLRAYEWQRLGVEAGKVRVAERICEPAYPNDDGRKSARPPCRESELPSGCKVLAGPTFGLDMPGVRASWVHCSKGRLAGRAGLWAWSGGPALAQATRHVHESPGLVWGSDAVALWLSDRGLVILDAALGVRLELPEIERIEPAVLDAELDRVLVHVADQHVVIDLRTGGRAPAIVGPPVDHAAFDPSGAHVAMAWASELAVFDVASGRQLARWSVDAAPTGLAWRQAGAVLFSGHTRALPELAWDPERGVRLPTADPSPSLLDQLAQGQLDPSWRWSSHDRGLTFVRVLDGAWVRPYPVSSVVIRSDGRYEIDEGDSTHFLDLYSLIEHGDRLGPLVPLAAVEEFRTDVFEPFARGLPLAPLALPRARWQALLEAPTTTD